MVNWVISNKEWIFSGIGIVIISWLFSYFSGVVDNKPANNQNIDGNNNLQIINNITPTNEKQNENILRIVKALDVYTDDQKSIETKNLSDVILLGRCHFAYESFLVMKLDKKLTKGYEEETLSLFKSLSHKFKLPDSIISSIDKLSKINNSQHLINESTKISHLIYDFLSVNNSSRYAHVYLLAVAKDTYLKLQENDFPKTTLDIFENLAQKQASMLGLPIEMVKNIVKESISYEDIITKIY